jgi:imidazolonepropionase-like amidohydrolase
MLNALLAAALVALPLDPDLLQPALALDSNEAAEAGAQAGGGTTAFVAKRVEIGDGTVLENGVVLVKDGVITAVGAQLDIPAGAAVVNHDGVLSPGMIALHSNDGAGNDLDESTRVVMPEAEARHAFHPEHGDFRRALEAGITALVLAPSSSNLIGGHTAIVKTQGGVTVKPSAQLMIGLSRDALNFNKFPTSYAGALEELERQFSDPSGAVARAVGGSLPVLMDVNDRAETLRALAFAKKFGLKGGLYGSQWAEDLVKAIKESGFDVVCSPFDVGENGRAIRAVVALSQAGVRVGFGLDAPVRHPESLRFGSAMCIRGGMSADAARRALTGDAALIAGVSGRIGRIARGLDADVVLWSGDPVSLTSSVEAVYINGELAFGGAK